MHGDTSFGSLIRPGAGIRADPDASCSVGHALGRHSCVVGVRVELDPPAWFAGLGTVALVVVVLLVISRNTAGTHGDLSVDR